jgi:hypothetical protein
VCVLKTLGLLLFIIYNLPFHEKMLNFQHIMNESLTGIAFALAFVFTKDLDEKSQYFHCKLSLLLPFFSLCDSWNRCDNLGLQYRVGDN